MIPNIHIAALGFKNIDKSLDFYINCLGWKLSKKKTGDLNIFNMGGFGLALYPIDELAKDANVKNDHSGFSGTTFSFNAKSEDEVDNILMSIKGFGVTISKPAEKDFWGGYSGYFKNPDGYLFEVAYNPFWEIDENNNIKF